MVLVPDFYTEVEEVSQEEMELFDAMNLNIEAYKGRWVGRWVDEERKAV